MTDLLTYPRLPYDVARTTLADFADLKPDELAPRSDVSHPSQQWHPTIPPRVTSAKLIELRHAIVDLAAAHGYPVPQPRGRHVTFDQRLGALLYEQMGIAPAEAANGGIWSFLALVLLPHVAVWRFPALHIDRFVGSDLMIGSSNRHVFGRLWARVHVLGPDASSRLGEDNVVNLLERPTFGGDPRLSRAIANTFLRTMSHRRGVQGQELMRDAIKRLRRLAVIITFAALDDAQLGDLL